jgi:hypothetical protein
MSVGTAASHSSDWPWQPKARQATTKSVTGCWSFGFACAVFACAVQQERVFAADSQQLRLPWQQLFLTSATGLTSAATMTLGVRGRPPASSPDFAASASAKSGGFTPFFSAQARRSASVWQQQDRQHFSAESQPHPLDAQGNNSPLFEVEFKTGSGTPDATARYISVATIAIARCATRIDVERRTICRIERDRNMRCGCQVWSLSLNRPVRRVKRGVRPCSVDRTGTDSCLQKAT